MKFQKGDMVEVFRRDVRSKVSWVTAEDNEEFHMDSYVNNGKYYEISESQSYAMSKGWGTCYYLNEEHGDGYWFPEHCLRLAKGYTPPTKQELVCIKIRQMYDKRKEAGYAF